MKWFICNVIGFTIFHLSEAATGGVLLERAFLEILLNWQEITCGKVSFSIKLHSEATASDFPRVFSWRFFVYLIWTEKWNEKREIHDGLQMYTFLLEYRFVWRRRFQKKNSTDGNLTRKCVDVAVFMVRGISLVQSF